MTGQFGSLSIWWLRPASYRNAIRSGELFIHDVAGIAGGGGLEDQNFRLAFGQRAMLDAPRHDAELARLENDAAIAELDYNLAAPDKEKFILMLVVMPRKDSRESGEFQFLAIQLGNHLRTPMLVD